MQTRTFGKTGLQVTPLGLGTAQIGYLKLSQKEADRLLHGALDAGLNVIDTAACYGNSEERIGNAISGRRAEFALISKCGHHVETEDPPEWTAPLIRRSAERSLRRLKTEFLDVLLLHSCSAEHLREGSIVTALQQVRADGFTRFIGYSGDGADLDQALELNVFDVIETSCNIVDQQVTQRQLPIMRERALGVLAKRPLANTAWRDLKQEEPEYEDYAAPYTRRFKESGISPEGVGFDGPWVELALRFAVHQPGVCVALTGSKNPDHLLDSIRIVEKGPLPESVLAKLHELWDRHDDGSWVGQV